LREIRCSYTVLKLPSVEIKTKLFLDLIKHNALKTYGRCSSTILNLGTRWRGVVRLTPLGKQLSAPIVQETGWAPEVVWKLLRKEKSLGTPGMDFREIGWHGMDWIDLAQDRDRWRALVNTVMNLRVPRKLRPQEWTQG
jgi:hypothetical protein